MVRVVHDVVVLNNEGESTLTEVDDSFKINNLNRW